MIFWFECRAEELPAHREWLSDAECTRLQHFRFPRRHDDWLLGRWAAKHAIAAFFQLPATMPDLRKIEVIPADSGAPEAYVSGRPAEASISITHRGNKAACAIAEATANVGCDMELVEPRSDMFVRDFFTAEEIEMVERCREAERSVLINLIWSAKESALKVQQVGLRADTRSVVVSLDNFERDSGDEWRSLRVEGTPGEVSKGWWKRSGVWISTVLSTQPSSPPGLLRASNSPGRATASQTSNFVSKA